MARPYSSSSYTLETAGSTGHFCNGTDERGGMAMIPAKTGAENHLTIITVQWQCSLTRSLVLPRKKRRIFEWPR
jgi:hypothetical protein